MSQVSRPMQIALAATMAFALLWLVALRPKASSGGAASTAAHAAPGTAGLKGSIDAAHDAVTTADAAARRASGDGSSSSGGAASAPAASAPASTGSATRGSHRHRGAARHARHHVHVSPQVRAIKTALRHREAVAIAFVEESAADSQAVAEEMRHVSTFDGRAVVLAVPLSQLSDYAVITNKVEVTVAPTVVIVDPRRRATTIVGFADRGEIEQRLADALATKR